MRLVHAHAFSLAWKKLVFRSSALSQSAWDSCCSISSSGASVSTSSLFMIWSFIVGPWHKVCLLTFSRFSLSNRSLFHIESTTLLPHALKDAYKLDRGVDIDIRATLSRPRVLGSVHKLHISLMLLPHMLVFERFSSLLSLPSIVHHILDPMSRAAWSKKAIGKCLTDDSPYCPKTYVLQTSNQMDFNITIIILLIMPCIFSAIESQV